MVVFFVISFICIVNIVLWGIFLSKFKKLFSTNDIRVELNRMIADINRNTAQDLSLIDGKMDELRTLLDIADKKIATAKKEAEKKAAAEAFEDEIEVVFSERRESFLPQKAQSAYVRVPASAPKVTLAEDTIEPKKASSMIISELHESGLSVEEIARRIGKTTTEVQTIIEMKL